MLAGELSVLVMDTSMFVGLSYQLVVDLPVCSLVNLVSTAFRVYFWITSDMSLRKVEVVVVFQGFIKVF